MTCKDKKSLAWRSDEVRVHLDGTKYPGYASYHERNWLHPSMYYLAVMDCEDEVHDFLGPQATGRIKVEWHLTSDGQETPYELQWSFQLDLFYSFVFIALAVSFTYTYAEYAKKAKILNSPHIYCMIALFLQMVANLFQAAYSGFYLYGNDYIGLDVVSTILDMLSECIMTLLIMLLTNGWWTRFQKIDMDIGMELYVPIFLFVVFVHVLLGAISFIEADAHHKYMDFEGVLAYFLIATKMALCCIQMYYYAVNTDKINRRAKDFYNKITIIGLIYLLSDPMMICSSYLLHEYNRHFYYRLMD